jgi:hypothetical protein
MNESVIIFSFSHHLNGIFNARPNPIRIFFRYDTVSKKYGTEKKG